MDNDEAVVPPSPPPPPPQFTLFGKLPAELRRMIWCCALGDDAPLHLHVGIHWTLKSVNHWCWAPKGRALCGHGDSCRAEKAPHRSKVLQYMSDGFFYAPEKPGRQLPCREPATLELAPEHGGDEGDFPAALELGPEHGSDEGGFHYHVGTACHEARQAFLKRFPQTMAMYKDYCPDTPGRYGPYRLVRFNSALDVLVARHWKLRPSSRQLETPSPPPRPTFASFRAALTSFRHLAFVATEQMTFQQVPVFTARNLYIFAESVECLSIGAVPHWHRLPDGAIRVDDVNALAADSVHIAHAQRTARSLASCCVRHGLRPPPGTPPWPPVDPDPGPDLWVLRPRPTPPAIGCYLAP